MTKKEDEFWKKQGERKLVRLIGHLHLTQECFMCRYKFKENPLSKFDKERGILSTFSAELLLHLKTTHGLDPEMFAAILHD